MQGIERPVDSTIVSKVIGKVYSKLHLGMRSYEKYAPFYDEISCVLFRYKRCVIRLSQKIDSTIELWTLPEDYSYKFMIKDYIDDDSLSLIFENPLGIIVKLLIKQSYMGKAIIDLVRMGQSKNGTYKNKPKMISSQYGSRLHDIVITCINDE